MRVLLAGPTDLAGFRAQARALLAQQVPPEQVLWETPGAGTTDLFGDGATDLFSEAGPDANRHALAPPHRGPEAGAGAVPAGQPLTVPASFLSMCEAVVLHADPQRFGLLYRLLWRLVHEPTLRHDPLDAGMLQAAQMAQSVRRDKHKMKAFVRFRPVHDGHASGDPLHVAWFEPEHHITQAVAPWFARRFTQMRWALLTPQVSVQWHPGPGAGGGALRVGPGAQRADAPPPDAGEQLWLTYYRHIFNPARLKLKAMQKEMPRKYWHNLPEAHLIAPLAAGAQNRSEAMIEDEPTTPRRRIPRAVAAPQNPQPARSSDGIASLDALKAATLRCRECPIGQFATQSVPGAGPLGARLMFVGEQPGDQEDLRGLPFVGPAGQLLDRALQALGLPREQVFVTNAVKHFKFELRGRRRIHKTPSQQEAAACRHWLEDEIALVRPQALVALGATAARALMGRAVPVLANRGHWLARGDGLRVLVTLHPSALLRMPPEDKEAAFAAFVDDLAQARPLFERA